MFRNRNRGGRKTPCVEVQQKVSPVGYAATRDSAAESPQAGTATSETAWQFANRSGPETSESTACTDAQHRMVESRNDHEPPVADQIPTMSNPFRDYQAK
jgi:hypothetical protein